ncbi:clathrin light chain isoform X1 [Bemisia tabaci]|uniref:clathrin light chain isoform X1 n=1 Tax=Bemisia tabaci TaxID=7038 RepID=UPI0008F98DA8|nr:PREDICTED: clathrin light chain isoform X2 [Bemisia tabaci]
MDVFGDNFEENDVDPAAEFLAREQDQLAGLEDEIKPANVPASAQVVNGISTIDDSTPEEPAETERPQNPPNDEDPLRSMSPDIKTTPPRSISPKGRLFSTPPPTKPAVAREEPEKIKIWREEQKKRLEIKDAEEEKKKEELRIAAKKELEEWYKHHKELIAKTKAANRNAEKQFVAESDEIEPGTEWERIAKLCDFNPKASRSSKDTSRMRSIILQLKQQPLKKGETA